jgi:hypothetical protein
LPPVVKPDEEVTEEYIPTVDELQKVDPGAKTQEGQEGGVDYSLIEVKKQKKKRLLKIKKKKHILTLKKCRAFREEMTK